ncbi:hypothetical protein BDZ94DRAFT_1253933 [Collybia nuda]|uniref:Uncharacterized protein n=1 Tax=Collybia nuda TaxID=64659 RepID=A0A9P6CKM2_9AGAR|nr:hypothetical protein BDZ94DRAFT_1253933 [Collybia nuda]
MQLKYISAFIFFAIVQVSAAPNPDTSPVVIPCHTMNECPSGDLCCGPFNEYSVGHCQNGALFCSAT